MAAVPTVTTAQLQAVTDPAVQNILRTIIDAAAVRSGSVGSGDQAYLTRDDLTSGGATARAIAMALARPIATAVSNPAGTDLTPLGDALEQRILASAAWQQMFTRIELIQAPDSQPGSLAYQLLTEAKARGAAVTKVTTIVQEMNESVAKTVETMTAAIKDNAAAIQKEEQTRATATDALAESQKLYLAQTNKSIAGLQDSIQVRTNSDNALAQALNTLWTRIGANTALVQTGSEIVANNVGSVVTKFEQLQAVTTDPATGLVAKYAALRQEYNVTSDAVKGMAAKWSVKLDLNGHISGLSLNAGVDANGKSESSFIVAADIFAIGAPGRPNMVPFALDVVTGLLSLKGSILATGTVQASALKAKTITAESGVIGDLAVTNANIANAAITTAKIRDASVDTLKIAGNSVTAMASSNGTRACSITIDALGVPIYLSATASGSTGDVPEAGYQQMWVVIERDGVEINRVISTVLIMAHEGGSLCATAVFVDYPSPGRHTYTFRSMPASEFGVFTMLASGARVYAALLETRR